MQRVGIKALKNNLSQYVRAAAAGERVLVTDRDKVVAELVAPREVEEPEMHSALLKGVREGWITPPTRRGPIPPPAGLPTMPLEQILEDLAKDREDRW